MKFDTRDTKPKLWNLAAFTGLTAVIVALLLLTVGKYRAAAVCGLMTAYALEAILLLLWAFREQLRYNPYSYNTIFYFGFALFSVYVLIAYLLLTVRTVRQPEVYQANMILHILLGSAENFMILSSPFLLVFSIALCISNISLIRHEGLRVVNLLGIVLSFLLLGGVLFLFRFDFYTSGSQREVMIHDLFANTFAAIYLYFECMLLGTMVADAIAARHEPEPDKDFLIVLGCGLRADGSPTPLLRGRLDRALGFYEKQKAQTGKALTFVVSGGQGPDEPVPESAAMKRYLTERGVPEDRMLLEDTVDIIFDLDGGHLRVFEGSYTEYRALLDEEEAAAEAEKARREQREKAAREREKRRRERGRPRQGSTMRGR